MSNHPRATYWRLPDTTIEFGPIPLLMGIVNVTPDSFSDGGCWLDPSQAVEHGLELIDSGADILDIGGESTRPYSEPVTADEQIRRVVPVLKEFARQAPTVPLSIDTSSARVAAVAVDAGARIINDVTGLAGDPEMIGLAARTGVAVCAMHMQGTPQTMQVAPHYDDCVAEIRDYLWQRKGRLLDAGIEREKICLDPGIGFGKTHEHNWELIRQIGDFHDLETPLLVGHSRKGFIGKIVGDEILARDAGTLGISLYLASQGIQILRIHEIRQTRAALKAFSRLCPANSIE
jgi:dihydropteroate synthase